jgi:glycosyltransferase involved in cell wall biosynthesis/GT2 family glycosyltransferase
VASAPEASADSRPVSISVVVCAFTTERLGVLSEAIESLRDQSMAPFEVVVVIDHNPELLEECRGSFPDAAVIANEEGQGLSGARNTGVARCRGDVVAFLDDDAFAAPDWLERLADAYRAPDVVGVGGTVSPRWEGGERPPWFPPEFDWVVGCTHSGMPARVEPVRNLVGANMSFRREALLEAGGFRRELGRVGTLPVGAEETDLCIRIGVSRSQARILYDPSAAVEHLVPPARASFSYFRRRCAAEGRSKAVLARLVGSRSGLSAERAYVRRTLPLGALRGLGDAVRGDGAGLRRAAAIAWGLASTSWGYARARAAASASVTDGGWPKESGGGALRVLMVTPRSPLEQGGVERHVMEVSRRLAADGVVVEVLCADPAVRGVVRQVADGVPIQIVRAWPAGRDWFLAPRLWREMGSRRPDLVHVQSYHTLVAPLAMLRALSMRVPYVVTFHGGGHSSGLRNRARGLQLRLLRPLLARAQRLVAVARFEIERYSRALRIPPERFALIPNGTEIAVGNGIPEAAGSTLATIGRLERYKGHHRVLAAFPHVLESRPEATLLVVGTGPYEDALRRQAQQLGVAERVEFTSVAPGDPQGMGELLGRVALVVLLSEFETHPLVALEAAAARRRLLVADNGGLGELAADGFGRAVPVDGEPEQIAAAILEELDRPPPQSAPVLTTWQQCAEALHDLYRSLATR